MYPVLHPINIASHGELGEKVIALQLEQIGPGSNLFLGDSISFSPDCDAESRQP
jgi:hypothetical protein